MVIQGFKITKRTLDHNSELSQNNGVYQTNLYQYDYRSLLNIPRPLYKDESKTIIPKIILGQTNSGKINIYVLNPPKDSSRLGIFVFKESYYDPSLQSKKLQTSIKNRHWVHPANSIGILNDNQFNNFEQRYPELLTNFNSDPLINTGFGSGLLFTQTTRYTNNPIPINQMTGIDDNESLIHCSFIQTEFELDSTNITESNNFLLQLNLSEWLTDASKPFYFKLPIQLQGYNNDFFVFVPPSNDKKNHFNNFLNELGGDETIDFFETQAFTAQDTYRWHLDDSYYLDILKLALKEKFGLREREDLPSDLGIVKVTTISVPGLTMERSTVNLIIINHTHMQLVGCHNNKGHKIKNLHFKFGLVDLDSGELFTISPQTLVIGTKKEILTSTIDEENYCYQLNNLYYKIV